MESRYTAVAFKISLQWNTIYNFIKQPLWTKHSQVKTEDGTSYTISTEHRHKLDNDYEKQSYAFLGIKTFNPSLPPKTCPLAVLPL